MKLHLILIMSPIGDNFRNRIRNFPSLVNCSTIIWYYFKYINLQIKKKYKKRYKDWPEEGLKAVATKTFSDVFGETELK